MSEPLQISFDVDCSPEHAFNVWTAGIATWWPPDHTVTGQAEMVVLESGVGGRIFERSSDGVEHDWGTVTAWEPPTRLAYQWHIGRDSADATLVEIRFIPRGTGSTRIEIEHWGWERLGAAADERRAQNQVGWESLLPHFRGAVANGGS